MNSFMALTIHLYNQKKVVFWMILSTYANQWKLSKMFLIFVAIKVESFHLLQALWKDNFMMLFCKLLLIKKKNIAGIRHIRMWSCEKKSQHVPPIFNEIMLFYNLFNAWVNVYQSNRSKYQKFLLALFIVFIGSVG